MKFMNPISSVVKIREDIVKNSTCGSNLSANHNMPIFIKMIKSPKLKIINGPNTNLSPGFKNKLTKAMTIAAIISSLYPPLNEKPLI